MAIMPFKKLIPIKIVMMFITFIRCFPLTIGLIASSVKGILLERLSWKLIKKLA